MNRRTIALGLASAVVASAAVAVPTFANSRGFGWGNGGVPPTSENGAVPPKFDDGTEAQDQRGQRPELTEEMETHRAAVEAAVEAGNYSAWVEAVNNENISDQVTAEEFPQYVQMHRLMKQAQELMEEARTIGEEIGLDHPQLGFGMMGPGRGMGRGLGHAIPTDGSTETED